MPHPKIIVNGALGKMGQITADTIDAAPNYNLVAKLTRNDNLLKTIETLKPDVVIDFTNASAVYDNAKTIIASNTRAIIGSSGLSDTEVQSLKTQCETQELGAIIAPNFSLGAILMMQCAERIATHFPNVEIIETHHEQKQDAPSGTAIKTAKLIQAARKRAPKKLTETNILPGSRGAVCDEVPIHALRLEGFVADQQVVFGGLGENLTISHKSLSRECFMPGVLLALQKVLTLKELVYGLETFID
jgi:4-hydroxy-tetrahydrodipicolinate reductase